MKKFKFELEGLECANCARKIQDRLSSNAKLNNVIVNFANSSLSFESSEDVDTEKEIVNEIKKIESDIKVLEINLEKKEANKEDKKSILLDFIRLIIGVTLAVISSYIKPELLKTIFMVLAYILLIIRTAKVAIKKIFKNKILDENSLICISAIGAYIVNKPMEGMMVLALYELGKILEKKAVNSTRKSIKELMNIRPNYANIKIGKTTNQIKPEDVNIGDVLVVKPGEKVPVDGIVVKGSTNLDKSVLTGESKYSKVNINDEILSGSVNVGDVIEIKATATYTNSTVSKILELTENATDRKAKTENFVSRLAKVYVPIVLILAVVVAILLPVVSNINYSESIYRALIFLVISCPCAIAISVPLSYFCGIGRASSSGILIKGSDYLDALRGIKVVVMDKTGTITTGKLSVSDITVINEKYTKEEILNICKLGESYSNHPIAKAIIGDSLDDIDMSKVKDHKEISGQGISFKLDDKQVLIGNEKLVESKLTEKKDATIIYVSVNSQVIGSVELKDVIKLGAKEAIQTLKNNNIDVKMFTGDNKEVAESVSKFVGIDQVYSEMLPEDKYNRLVDIIESKKSEYDKVAFVGDGINDSPTIALADVGISMGGVGVSSSIEASDLVIMTDELSKITEAIDISKYTNTVIKENLIFAIGTKITFLTLSVFGLTNMALAVFADVGVTLITILNSIRILKNKKMLGRK